MVCLLISAPIKHEPSHKYYYDYINLLAKKINIDYNKEEVVDDWIYEYGIFYRIIWVFILMLDMLKEKYTEIIAEALLVIDKSQISQELIDLLRWKLC